MQKWMMSVLVWGLSSWLIAATPSQDEAVNWMQRMVQAFDSLHYDGIFVRSQGVQMNTMQVRRMRLDGSEYQSLLDLDGDKIEVIRVDDSVICVYPDMTFNTENAAISAPLHSFKTIDTARLQQGYVVTLGPVIQLAGRATQQVTLSPKDDYRYAHQFWLDQHNAFLIKHDMLDGQKRVLDRIQFTHINFAPALEKSDFQPKMGHYAQHLVTVEAQMIDHDWQLGWQPPGFMSVWQTAKKINETTIMLLISDGLVSISIFIETQPRAEKNALMKMGPTAALQQMRTFATTPYLLTAVGEVPELTLQRLLQALTLEKTAQ